MHLPADVRADESDGCQDGSSVPGQKPSRGLWGWRCPNPDFRGETCRVALELDRQCATGSASVLYDFDLNPGAVKPFGIGASQQG